MITPSFGLTATERVLPRMALDFTTGVLDPRVTVARLLNTATRVNSSGYIETVNANLPRFDYSPVTLAAKGLLIEEARTNLQINSNLFNAWAKSNISVTIDATEVSPDGLNNANKIEYTAAPGSLTTNPSVALSAGSHTASVYAKKGNTDFIALRLRQPGVTDVAFVRFNLATGAVASTIAGSGTITDVGGGWYRCTVTGTAAAANHVIIIYPNNDSGTAAGQYVFCFGAQLEAGAFATSYIPTTTTSLTRNNDIVSMTGANFSDWYNASGGSFVFEGSAVRPFGFAYLVLASDNTNTNRFGLYKSGNAVSGFVVSSGAAQMEITGSPIVANVPFKAAVAAQANSGNFSFNGSIGTNDTAIVMPTVNQLTIGSFQNLSPLNGHARAVRYYLPRLTNAELQAFST